MKKCFLKIIFKMINVWRTLKVRLCAWMLRDYILVFYPELYDDIDHEISYYFRSNVITITRGGLEQCFRCKFELLDIGTKRSRKKYPKENVDNQKGS